MNEAALIEMGEYLRNIKIPDVSDNTNFWLIRTMKGYFYDEFINQNYVALGWNFVTQNTSFDKMNIEILMKSTAFHLCAPASAIPHCTSQLCFYTHLSM